MNEINLLKQASLADKMGNYKLADQIYNKVFRLASAVSATEKAIIETLEKLGLSEAEKSLIKAGEASFEKGLEKAGGEALSKILDKRGIEAVEKALSSGDDNALKEFIKLTGKTEEKEITAEIARLKSLRGIEREGAIKSLRADIQTRLRRGIPLSVPPLEKIDVLKNSKVVMQWLQQVGFPGWKKVMTNLPLLSKGLKALGLFIAVKEGVPRLFNLAGSEVNPWDYIPKLLPFLPGGGSPESTPPGGTDGSGTDGSGTGGSGTDGSGGASETPGKPNYEYTTPDEMYNLRMKAKLPSGVSQQELQGAKAQEYVNANKDKFKSQREFYDAALGAGDKNFANSVIALVKKDIPALPREPAS